MKSIVEKLQVENNKVKAVQLQDGSVIEAPTVIAACDPHTVLVNWIDEAPVSAKSLISRWQRNLPQKATSRNWMA
ncbi:MAG: hypothetical protein CM15mP49_29740 [Actinomycetota bacterium]|nr:MAG: hypothetical protein CM15mP49_29740 [Actinomycetota bacterium]